MCRCLKPFKQFLVLIIGVIFLAGCGPEFDGLEKPYINNAQEIDGVEGSLDRDEDEFFITKWKTDNSSVFSNENQITILTSGKESYKYDIEWGDGTINRDVIGSIVHTYSHSGVYQVKIAGKFPQIIFNYRDFADDLKLISIEQWGKIRWKSMSEAFSGCSNMVGNFTDSPDLSHVKSMEGMFDSAKLFNSDISDWDVSHVKEMSAMFSGAVSFNQNVENWDVSKVERMNSMFYNAKSFSNRDLSLWDVSNVEEHSTFSTGWGEGNIEPSWRE